MEYAHLFPKLDITGKANLAGLHGSVHIQRFSHLGFSETHFWTYEGTRR